jgi:hypothetical protein
MSTFFILIDRPADEEGNTTEPEVIAEVEVRDGRLVVVNTDQWVSEVSAPLARTIRRKLAPKSGNQLFVN